MAAGRGPSTIRSICPADRSNCITKLPKAEHAAPEWQQAMQARMLIACGGPTMLARIGVISALHRHDVHEFNSDRKELHWAKRKLARDRQLAFHRVMVERVSDPHDDATDVVLQRRQTAK
jgi:hypothetical protein